MFWVVVWRLPGMLFCGLTRAGGSTQPDQRKRNLAHQTWYAAVGEHSRGCTYSTRMNYKHLCDKRNHRYIPPEIQILIEKFGKPLGNAVANEMMMNLWQYIDSVLRIDSMVRSGRGTRRRGNEAMFQRAGTNHQHTITCESRDKTWNITEFQRTEDAVSTEINTAPDWVLGTGYSVTILGTETSCYIRIN